MKGKILILSILVFLFVSLEQLYTATKTLKVGFYNNSPKIYLSKDNKPTGFWAELTQYIAKKENWKLEWQFASWQKCLNKLENNQLDIMIDVGETPDREKKFLFNKIPVLISWVRLYKAKGSNINSILDLKDKKVAALRGSFDLNGPEGLKNTLKSFGIKCQIIEMNTYKDIFEALNDKKIDAGVVDADFGNKNSQNYNIEKTFILFQPAQMKYAFPKNKKYLNIIKKIDSDLAILKQNKNSIYYRLLDKYLIGRKEVKVFPKGFKYFIIVLISLLLLVMIFNFVLKYQVDKKTKQLKKDLEIIKKSEEKINHLNRILRTITQINKIISRERDLSLLITKICDEIVESQSYKRSWIALFDKKEKLINFAASGFDDLEDRLKNVLAGNKKPEKIYKILNSDKIVIVKNPQKSCADCAMSKMLKNEILMNVRIKTKNLIGLFCVSIPNIKLFSEEEKKLFQNLSDDISLALSGIEVEKEKLEAETKLKENEEKYRAIVEQAFEGISLFDLEEIKIIDANKAYLDMLGYTKEELLSLPIENLVSDREKIKRSLKEIQNCQDVDIIRCNLKRKDGSIVNTEISSRTIKLGNKKIILSVVRDITEKLKIDEKLRKAEENYRILAQTMPDLVIIIDLTGKILYVNSAAEKLGKSLKKNVIGQHVYDFILPEYFPRAKENLAKRASGDTGIYHYEMILDDGKDFKKPFEVTSTPIIENGKITKVLLIAHDITERKKQMEMIENNLKEKEILIRELYHRTKNNMQIISSLISIQSRKFKEESIKKSFREIISKINSMALVHQKLYETKNLNRINLKNYIVDLFELIKQSYHTNEKPLKINISLDDCFVGIDHALNLGLILNELITNIFKYGISKDGVTNIRIELKCIGKTAELFIEDNGFILDKNRDLRNSQSMGLRTVFSLVEYKLNGKIDYKIENGLKWHIKFTSN